MSNEERISWGALLVNLIIASWYFGRILLLPADADLFGPQIFGFTVKLVILAILISIGCEVLLHIVQKSTGGGGDVATRDERDALINLKATRNAHGVLGIAVVVVLVQIALTEWARRFRGREGDPDTIFELLASGPLQGMHIAQLLLAALTLSALTLNASRILCYRRGC